MKNKLLIISALILILSLGLNFILFKSSSNNRSKADRWENNFKESKDSISILKLTLSEFKENKSKEIDSLLKQLKVKPRQVERIITITNTIETIPDTIKVEVKPISDVNNYSFTEKLDCIEVSGFIVSESAPNLYLTSVVVEVNTTYVAYKERQKHKILGINTRLFGKKITRLEIKPSCGRVQVLEIDIIKK